MVRNKLAAAILSAGLALPGLASALGVGDYTLKSYLNQPLELEIELIQTKDLSNEEVLAALASQEEFASAGVDRVFFLADISFEVSRRDDGSMFVVARSRKPVTEPFLNFLLEVQWPQGRMLREYTILLDPPVYKSGASATAMAEPVVVAAPEPAPEAAPAIVPVQPAMQPAPVVDASLPPPPSGSVARETPVPQPKPAAEPTPEAVGGDYRVQSGDTMMQIASRHRGGASVQQTMMAIQRANPDAFIKGNVNLVKKGAVLRIPDESEVQQISVAEAKNDISAQNRAWRELIDQRAAALPSEKAQIEAAAAPVAKAPAAKGTGAGEVTLVAPTASAKAGKAAGGKEPDAAARKEIARTQEAVDKAARENEALAGRVAELDKQVKGSEQSLGLKNDQIAGLQAELERLRKEKGQPAAETAAAAEAAPAADAAQPAPAETAAAQPPKKSKPKKAEPQPAPAPQSPSLLGPIAGLIALAAAGGAGFWFWRRKKAQQGGSAAVSRIEDELHDDQVADDLAQLQDLNLGHDDEEPAGSHAPAHVEGESGDPLGEADMYMAYGRFQQAADILYAALQREPERDDIRVKLAEVYAEMGDADSAREQASSVAGSSSADIRRQAAAVLARVGGAAAVSAAADADEVPSLDDLALEFSGGKQEPAAAAADDFSFDLADEAPAAAGNDSLEFSLDDFAADDDSTQLKAKPAAGMGELSLEDAGLGEFSLDDETPAAAPTVAGADDFTLEDELTLEAAAPATDDELTLADEIDFSAEADAAVEESAASADELLDLGVEEEVVAAAPPPATPSAADLDLESELADLQADLTTEGGADGGGDDFDFLSDSDENATKLDLAKAYIDMGDAEGARDILNEVVAEGNAAQKTEAQKLLAQVG